MTISPTRWLLAGLLASVASASSLPAGTAQLVSSVTTAAGTALHWHRCPPPPPSLQIDPRQQCATLKVPLDYRHPGGRTLSLAISRIPAGDPGNRRGVLLLNPGGPGAEGLDLPSEFAHLTSPAVLDAYDRIGFDPRGVGHSTPVTCGLKAANLLPNTAYPDPHGSIAVNAAAARTTATRCWQHAGTLLPYITTANTARDMDQIRKALGESRISYYGGSYGTYLGAVYASLYPLRTDRIVLDSAVDPSKIWYGEFQGQGAAMARRFPDLTAYVASHRTLGFGTTAAQVSRSYLALAHRLDLRPAKIPGSRMKMSGNMLRFITFNLLYQDAAIPPLAQTWRAAAELARGDATKAQVSLVKLVLQTLSPAASTSPGVPADNQLAAAYAVLCDDVRWPQAVATYAHNVVRDRRTFPLTAGFPSDIWPCAFWRTAPLEPPIKVTRQGPRNILVLQNQRDPATSLASARGMRKSLGNRAVLVTVDAGGHGVLGMHGTGDCADRIANAFLVSGALPTKDVDCPGS